MSVCAFEIPRALGAVLLIGLAGCQAVRDVHRTVHPEQTRIEFRSDEAFPKTPLPTVSPPRTVSNPENGEEDLSLSLDEAIRIALRNSEVIRVNAGVTAVSSGQTIYDPGIANADIDQARGRFDPVLSLNNRFRHEETPRGVFDPPPVARIDGRNTDFYDLDAELSKTNPLGGSASLRVGAMRSEIEPGQFPLNPETSHFTELSYVQPLLRGGGLEANLAPILISRLDTERSFFQFKDGIQELVRGVVEAYWTLVFARTDLWARQQQVAQSQFAFEREDARLNRGLGDLGQLSQARLAYTGFVSDVVSAEANVLQSENALLNILGVSPTEVGEVVPTTPPYVGRLEWQWNEIVTLAERHRPDIIELKLILEADRQRLARDRNEARPSVDAFASYRWNGLRGRTPAGPTISTGRGEYTDWALGVNFSVPLALREARAAVRQQELLIFRDEANLRQGLHAATHQLALSVRNLDQFYEQYEAFRVTREAARDNLERQQAAEGQGLVPFITLLQAIVSWGNAVSSEARSLTQFNTELASLERETGTILETHGVRFVEERFQFAGPMCCLKKTYPGAIAPTSNTPRYESGDAPAEQSFDLRDPLEEDMPDIEPPPPPASRDPGSSGVPGNRGVSPMSSRLQRSSANGDGNLQSRPGGQVLRTTSQSRGVREMRFPSPIQAGINGNQAVVTGGAVGSGSFVAQGVNGIQTARPPRRIEPEEDADDGRKENGDTRGRQ